MEETNQIEGLLQRLEEHRLLYLDTYARVQDLLGQSGSPAPTPTASQFGAATLHPGSIDIPKSTSPSPGPPNSRRRRTITSQPDLARDVLSRKVPLATLPAASLSGETDLTSEHDDNEELYVQAPLETHDYDHEGLRDHLRSHKWTSDGRTILEGIVNNPTRMQAPTLFPIYPGPVEDLSHFSHHQVFDVGSDGAPLPVELPEAEQGPSNAMTIWNTIRTLNPPTKERKAVGRIAIVREPSPMLFGAIHYTMNNSFYMDELFQHLTESGASCADFHRAFDEDERMQRSFVFNFEYFTIVGEEREPMEWQMAANQRERNSHHIAITRCSSVIALSLGGEPLKKIKNPSRRAKTTHGYAYDPFAPWKILHLQCYPDWKASTDIHDSTKHYVNGVEAFMVSLLGEFRDCQKRFQEIYDRITKLITPPLDFMFNATIRDKLLFEDAHFTYSRRYFWAYQSLGIVNDSIKAIIDAYEDTFTPEVWEGKHGTLWPLLDQDSERNMYYKKKMASLKKKFEIEINNLRTRMSDNHKRRIEIRGLREELFTGTSIQESRKSVENTEITIQQGHNIKLLTLVSIFFLPLTFVTSVFGMSNIDQHEAWSIFAIVTVTVCVPFFVLIGSLNTTRGMYFWRQRTHAALDRFSEFFAWVSRGGKKKPKDPLDENAEDDFLPNGGLLRRSTGTREGMAMRLRGRSSMSRLSVESLDAKSFSRLPQLAQEAVKPSFVLPHHHHRHSNHSRIAQMWTEERKRHSTEM